MSLLGVLSAPLRSYLASQVQELLSKYISNIRIDTVGILGSDISLNDLELRLGVVEELFAATVPVRLIHGHLKRLRVQIPWGGLLSSPIQVSVEGLSLALRFAEPHELVSAPRENPVPASTRPAPAAPAQGWMAAFLRGLLSSAQVRIDGIAVRLVHGTSQLAALVNHAWVRNASVQSDWRSSEGVTSEHSWKETIPPSMALGSARLATKECEIEGLVVVVERARARRGKDRSRAPSADSELAMFETGDVFGVPSSARKVARDRSRGSSFSRDPPPDVDSAAADSVTLGDRPPQASRASVTESDEGRGSEFPLLVCPCVRIRFAFRTDVPGASPLSSVEQRYSPELWKAVARCVCLDPGDPSLRYSDEAGFAPSPPPSTAPGSFWDALSSLAAASMQTLPRPSLAQLAEEVYLPDVRHLVFDGSVSSTDALALWGRIAHPSMLDETATPGEEDDLELDEDLLVTIGPLVSECAGRVIGGAAEASLRKLSELGQHPHSLGVVTSRGRPALLSLALDVRIPELRVQASMLQIRSLDLLLDAAATAGRLAAEAGGASGIELLRPAVEPTTSPEGASERPGLTLAALPSVVVIGAQVGSVEFALSDHQHARAAARKPRSLTASSVESTPHRVMWVPVHGVGLVPVDMTPSAKHPAAADESQLPEDFLALRCVASTMSTTIWFPPDGKRPVVRGELCVGAIGGGASETVATTMFQLQDASWQPVVPALERGAWRGGAFRCFWSRDDNEDGFVPSLCLLNSAPPPTSEERMGKLFRQCSYWIAGQDFVPLAPALSLTFQNRRKLQLCECQVSCSSEDLNRWGALRRTLQEVRGSWVAWFTEPTASRGWEDAVEGNAEGGELLLSLECPLFRVLIADDVALELVGVRLQNSPLGCQVSKAVLLQDTVVLQDAEVVAGADIQGSLASVSIVPDLAKMVTLKRQIHDIVAVVSGEDRALSLTGSALFRDLPPPIALRGLRFARDGDKLTVSLGGVEQRSGGKSLIRCPSWCSSEHALTAQIVQSGGGGTVVDAQLASLDFALERDVLIRLVEDAQLLVLDRSSTDKTAPKTQGIVRSLGINALFRSSLGAALSLCADGWTVSWEDSTGALVTGAVEGRAWAEAVTMDDVVHHLPRKHSAEGILTAGWQRLEVDWAFASTSQEFRVAAHSASVNGVFDERWPTVFENLSLPFPAEPSPHLPPSAALHTAVTVELDELTMGLAGREDAGSPLEVASIVQRLRTNASIGPDETSLQIAIGALEARAGPSLEMVRFVESDRADDVMEVFFKLSEGEGIQLVSVSGSVRPVRVHLPWRDLLTLLPRAGPPSSAPTPAKRLALSCNLDVGEAQVMFSPDVGQLGKGVEFGFESLRASTDDSGIHLAIEGTFVTANSEAIVLRVGVMCKVSGEVLGGAHVLQPSTRWGLSLGEVVLGDLSPLQSALVDVFPPAPPFDPVSFDEVPCVRFELESARLVLPGRAFELSINDLVVAMERTVTDLRGEAWVRDVVCSCAENEAILIGVLEHPEADPSAPALFVRGAYRLDRGSAFTLTMSPLTLETRLDSLLVEGLGVTEPLAHRLRLQLGQIDVKGGLSEDCGWIQASCDSANLLLGYMHDKHSLLSRLSVLGVHCTAALDSVGESVVMGHSRSIECVSAPTVVRVVQSVLATVETPTRGEPAKHHELTLSSHPDTVRLAAFQCCPESTEEVPRVASTRGHVDMFEMNVQKLREDGLRGVLGIDMGHGQSLTIEDMRVLESIELPMEARAPATDDGTMVLSAIECAEACPHVYLRCELHCLHPMSDASKSLAASFDVDACWKHRTSPKEQEAVALASSLDWAAWFLERPVSERVQRTWRVVWKLETEDGVDVLTYLDEGAARALHDAVNEQLRRYLVLIVRRPESPLAPSLRVLWRNDVAGFVVRSGKDSVGDELAKLEVADLVVESQHGSVHIGGRLDLTVTDEWEDTVVPCVTGQLSCSVRPHHLAVRVPSLAAAVRPAAARGVARLLDECGLGNGTVCPVMFVNGLSEEVLVPRWPDGGLAEATQREPRGVLVDRDTLMLRTESFGVCHCQIQVGRVTPVVSVGSGQQVGSVLAAAATDGSLELLLVGGVTIEWPPWLPLRVGTPEGQLSDGLCSVLHPNEGAEAADLSLQLEWVPTRECSTVTLPLGVLRIDSALCFSCSCPGGIHCAVEVRAEPIRWSEGLSPALAAIEWDVMTVHVLLAPVVSVHIGPGLTEQQGAFVEHATPIGEPSWVIQGDTSRLCEAVRVTGDAKVLPCVDPARHVAFQLGKHVESYVPATRHLTAVNALIRSMRRFDAQGHVEREYTSALRAGGASAADHVLLNPFVQASGAVGVAVSVGERREAEGERWELWPLVKLVNQTSLDVRFQLDVETEGGSPFDTLSVEVAVARHAEAWLWDLPWEGKLALRVSASADSWSASIGLDRALDHESAGQVLLVPVGLSDHCHAKLVGFERLLPVFATWERCADALVCLNLKPLVEVCGPRGASLAHAVPQVMSAHGRGPLVLDPSSTEVELSEHAPASLSVLVPKTVLFDTDLGVVDVLRAAQTFGGCMFSLGWDGWCSPVLLSPLDALELQPRGDRSLLERARTCEINVLGRAALCVSCGSLDVDDRVAAVRTSLDSVLDRELLSYTARLVEGETSSVMVTESLAVEADSTSSLWGSLFAAAPEPERRVGVVRYPGTPLRVEISATTEGLCHFDCGGPASLLLVCEEGALKVGDASGPLNTDPLSLRSLALGQTRVDPMDASTRDMFILSVAAAWASAGDEVGWFLCFEDGVLSDSVSPRIMKDNVRNEDCDDEVRIRVSPSDGRAFELAIGCTEDGHPIRTTVSDVLTRPPATIPAALTATAMPVAAGVTSLDWAVREVGPLHVVRKRPEETPSDPLAMELEIAAAMIDLYSSEAPLARLKVRGGHCGVRGLMEAHAGWRRLTVQLAGADPLSNQASVLVCLEPAGEHPLVELALVDGTVVSRVRIRSMRTSVDASVSELLRSVSRVERAAALLRGILRVPSSATTAAKTPPVLLTNVVLEKQRILVSALWETEGVRTGIREASVGIREQRYQLIYGDGAWVAERLGRNVVRDAIGALPGVIGSLDLLGNISGGLRAMFGEYRRRPVDGRGRLDDHDGEDELEVGVPDGVVERTTEGIMEVFATFSEVVATNTARLSMDPRFVSRVDATSEAPAEGVLSSLQEFGSSLLDGLAGVVRQPLQVAQSGDGTPVALAGGVARGLAGLIAKPLSSAASLLSRNLRSLAPVGVARRHGPALGQLHLVHPLGDEVYAWFLQHTAVDHSSRLGRPARTHSLHRRLLERGDLDRMIRDADARNDTRWGVWWPRLGWSRTIDPSALDVAEPVRVRVLIGIVRCEETGAVRGVAVWRDVDSGTGPVDFVPRSRGRERGRGLEWDSLVDDVEHSSILGLVCRSTGATQLIETDERLPHQWLID
jgi:hypothetical protein